MIVADTNLIAGLWVPNQMEELAYATLKKDPDWVAPVLWKSEFRNVLSLFLRKEILELVTVLQVMEEAEEFMESKEFEVNSTQVLSFVSNSSCSSYDCEFITLADDLHIRLVTFDKKLLVEFPSTAIHPLDFVA
jgi:predicted nucleic acid-binding protein